MLEKEFSEIAQAGIRICGELLDSLSPEQQKMIEDGLHAGARMSLELGPLPGFEFLRLVMIEHEGKRHSIATLEVNRGPVQ